MSEDIVKNISARKRRVKRLKGMIVLMLSALVVLPLVCTIILMIQVQRLNGRVDALTGQLSGLEKSIRQELVKVEEKEDLSEISVSVVQGAVLDIAAQPQPPLLDNLAEDGAENGFIPSAENGAENGFIPSAEDGAENDFVPSAENGLPEAAVTQGHKVYLTFDDGPSIYTDDILDLLKEYDLKATFFVVGKEDENSKKAIRRIVEEGHTLGMHSYSHIYSELYASKENFAADLSKLRTYLYDLTGVESQFYRFPGGSSNTVSAVAMQELADYLDCQGIVFYDWNIASGDGAKTLLSVNALVSNCTKDLGKWDTTVILMHDSADKPTTIKALPIVIEKILAMEDTVILPITEDTVPVQHIPRNE